MPEKTEAVIRLSRKPLEGGVEVPSKKKVCIQWGDMSDTIQNHALYSLWVKFEDAKGNPVSVWDAQITVLE